MGTTARDQIPDAEFNTRMATMFRRAAALLEAQDADTFRVLAYRNGADELESLTESAAQIYRRDGLWGLIALPTIGRSLALAIADVVDDGHWRWLDRLEGDTDPEKVLATLPTIGPKLARRLHLELGIESLDDLERAIYDGRLGRLRGIGDKRWHAIRDSVFARLHPRRSGPADGHDHTPIRTDRGAPAEHRPGVPGQGRSERVGDDRAAAVQPDRCPVAARAAHHARGTPLHGDVLEHGSGP